MAYFKKVKVKDKLYGIVFGAGKVTQVFEDSHYKMMVTFKNGYEVPYTEDGIPGWGNFKKQTISSYIIQSIIIKERRIHCHFDKFILYFFRRVVPMSRQMLN